MERFNTIGVIKNEVISYEHKMKVFSHAVNFFLKKGKWSRLELIELFNIWFQSSLIKKHVVFLMRECEIREGVLCFVLS